MLPNNEDILISSNFHIRVDGRAYLDPESEHLACFIGGAFAIGGRIFEQNDYIKIGSKLALGCAYVYSVFPTGIMLERFDMVPFKSRLDCSWDEGKWDQEKHKRPEWREHLPQGFTTAKDPRYLLRPEAIETLFILYRVTGDAKFQDIAWEMYTAIKTGTETNFANAAIKDVTVAQYPLPKEDYMEACRNIPAESVHTWLELLACGDVEVFLFDILTA